MIHLYSFSEWKLSESNAIERIPFPEIIENLSEEDAIKLKALAKQIQFLRKDHKISGFTEVFVERIMEILTGVEMPRTKFHMSRASWGLEWVDLLTQVEVLINYKVGRAMWLKSGFSADFTAKFIKNREEYEESIRGVTLAKNLSII